MLSPLGTEMATHSCHFASTVSDSNSTKGCDKLTAASQRGVRHGRKQNSSTVAIEVGGGTGQLDASRKGVTRRAPAACWDAQRSFGNRFQAAEHAGRRP